MKVDKGSFEDRMKYFEIFFLFVGREKKEKRRIMIVDFFCRPTKIRSKNYYWVDCLLLEDIRKKKYTENWKKKFKIVVVENVLRNLERRQLIFNFKIILLCYFKNNL